MTTTPFESELRSVEFTPEAISADIARPEHEYRRLDQLKVEELIESIGKLGLINPITVRLNPLPGPRYVLIAGAHRLAAMTYLSHPNVETTHPFEERFMVNVVNTDADGAELVAVAENLVRNDLSVAERKKARAKVAKLMTPESINGLAWKPPVQKDLAKAMKVTQKLLSNSFAAWQKQWGDNVRWADMDNDDYQGFCRYLEDDAERARAKSAESKRRKALTPAERRAEDAAIKAKEAAEVKQRDAEEAAHLAKCEAARKYEADRKARLQGGLDAADRKAAEVQNTLDGIEEAATYGENALPKAEPLPDLPDGEFTLDGNEAVPVDEHRDRRKEIVEEVRVLMEEYMAKGGLASILIDFIQEHDD